MIDGGYANRLHTPVSQRDHRSESDGLTEIRLSDVRSELTDVPLGERRAVLGDGLIQV